MATQTEMRTMRTEVIELLASETLQGYEYEGIISDGVLLYHAELDTHIVLKVIVKKEGFDAEDELASYQEKQDAIAEKLAEKAEKAAKRAEKLAEKAAETEA